MLKMRSLILNFFELVLRIAFKLILNTRHKILKIAKVLSKKELKFLLGHKNIHAFVITIMTFVLNLMEANVFAEKKNPKQSAVGLISPNGIKMIIVLLAKVITINI